MYLVLFLYSYNEYYMKEVKLYINDWSNRSCYEPIFYSIWRVIHWKIWTLQQIISCTTIINGIIWSWTVFVSTKKIDLALIIKNTRAFIDSIRKAWAKSSIISTHTVAINWNLKNSILNKCRTNRCVSLVRHNHKH